MIRIVSIERAIIYNPLGSHDPAASQRHCNVRFGRTSHWKFNWKSLTAQHTHGTRSQVHNSHASRTRRVARTECTYAACERIALLRRVDKSKSDKFRLRHIYWPRATGSFHRLHRRCPHVLRLGLWFVLRLPQRCQYGLHFGVYVCNVLPRQLHHLWLWWRPCPCCWSRRISVSSYGKPLHMCGDTRL